jgi:hypothetical protein
MIANIGTTTLWWFFVRRCLSLKVYEIINDKRVNKIMDKKMLRRSIFGQSEVCVAEWRKPIKQAEWRKPIKQSPVGQRIGRNPNQTQYQA